MSEQNADPRPVYRRLRRRAPNAADVAPADVAMSRAADVPSTDVASTDVAMSQGDVAPTGGAGPSLAAGGAGPSLAAGGAGPSLAAGGAGPSLAAGGAAERGTKRRHGEIQSTGVEVGQISPRQILSDAPGYVKFLVEQHHLVQKENERVIRSLLSDVGLAIDELRKTLEINRHSFLASLESACQECEQKLTEEKANAEQLFEELVKCKASHDQAFKDAVSTLTEETGRLIELYDHSSKSDESLALSFAGKIDQLAESLNRRDQDLNVSAKVVVEAGKLAPGLRD